MERILPAFLALITGSPRQKVPIEWSRASWTHNVFRVWELLFWRRTGIRRAVTVSFGGIVDGKRVLRYDFGEWEAAIAHCETLVRGLFKLKKLYFKFVPLMQLTTQAGPLLPSVYSFAIAFDTYSDSGVTDLASGVGYSVTINGSNRYAVIAVRNLANTDTVTGVTINAVGATRLAGALRPTFGRWWYLYSLVAPSTGAQTCTTTLSASDQYIGSCTNYTGVAQSSTVDGTSGTSTGTSSAHLTASITTSNAGTWTGCVLSTNNSGGNISSFDSPTTARSTLANDLCYCDSNGTVAAGSNSLGCVLASSVGGWEVVITAFNVAASGASVTRSTLLNLLGVGS